jgi:hypothetical protein
MKKTIKEKNAQPGAWIVNPKDRGRKSIKKGNIYLKNGEEFEIEIFNPLKKSILADIRLNGESISKGGLVVKPGQRCYLDCFIDDKRKFKFETYNVDDSDEVKEAISNNGLLEIFFYKEEIIKFDNWINYYPIYVHPYKYPYQQPYQSPYWYGTTSNNITSTNISNDVSGIYNSRTSASNDLSMSYSSDFKSFETGRVEKGEKSNQNFYEVNMNFEKNHIHSVIYKLLPESQMPKEIKNKKKVNETDLLYKLSELKDAGILTEQEFKEKKKEILSRI